jgi:hypothetical protein
LRDADRSAGFRSYQQPEVDRDKGKDVEQEKDGKGGVKAFALDEYACDAEHKEERDGDDVKSSLGEKVGFAFEQGVDGVDRWKERSQSSTFTVHTTCTQ